MKSSQRQDPKEGVPFGSCSRLGRSRFSAAWLEPELDTRLIPEVALILVSRGESVAKPGEHVINLRGPEGDGVRQRDIDTAADHEVECVVAWVVNDASRQLFA